MVRLDNLYKSLAESLNTLSQDQGRLKRSRSIVDEALEQGKTHYGINTGFGVLAREKIPFEQVRKLQKNLLLSHAVGVGDPIPKEITKLMLDIKIHSLGLGFSGVSLETFDRLLEFSRNNLVPQVPSRGSVGASGDLAPLAHMALPLIGKGYFWNEAGTGREPADRVLERHGIKPLDLQAKDGLSLINGTQLMSGYGAWILERSQRLIRTADIAGAMTLEALQGSLKPFDARIQEVRPHPGQAATAEHLRMLLEGSQIMLSHRDCSKVQDPYSLRCMPQVHGASRDALDYSCAVVEREINSATDNPLVFQNGDIISGGNFHGQPLALALDFAAIALAELAGISERRTYLLLDGTNGLPSLLMKDTGINSGFMIPQYTSAALVSENKVLCHPASVDSIPTSLGQEDHQSMGSISALKLLQIYSNVRNVLAIELLTASQALDFRKPLRPGLGVERAHEYVRALVPHRDVDDSFIEDMEAIFKLVDSHDFSETVNKIKY
jgi:histidine ammonia-lyase